MIKLMMVKRDELISPVIGPKVLREKMHLIMNKIIIYWGDFAVVLIHVPIPPLGGNPLDSDLSVGEKG